MLRNITPPPQRASPACEEMPRACSLAYVAVNGSRRGEGRLQMHGRLFFVGTLIAVAVFANPGRSAAIEPNSQSNEMAGYTSALPPMTAAQRVTYEQKMAMLARLEQDAQAPTNGQAGHAVDAALASRFVNTWERQQTTNYNCGPTAVQVVADYSWNMGPDRVKFTQSAISQNWTHTDTSGTTTSNELAGANGVLSGSPRSSFVYAIANPSSGANWMSLLQVDVNFTMPQILNLSPWWWSSSQGIWYYLVDWAGNQSTGGHYVVANGYTGNWDGTSGPTVRFDDGAAGYGGGTGTYTDVQSDVYQLISHHHNVVIW